MKSKTSLRRLLCLVLLSATLLVLSLGLCGCTAEMAPKDEILAATLELDGASEKYDYVGSYLSDLGYEGFDKVKFRRIELYFASYYIKELPKAAEMAKLTSTYFLENLYDSTDLSDRTALTDGLIRCYVASTGDKYAFYRNEQEYEDYETDMSGVFVGIGVTVNLSEENEIRVIEVLEGSGAKDAGILVDDLIIGVDGVSYTEVEYEAFVNLIRGEEGSTVEVTVLRGEETLTFTVTRKRLVESTVSYAVNDDGIGYLHISRFKGNTAEQFGEALEALKEAGVKGIVFDLRNNPGGYLNSVVDVLEYFVKEGVRIVSYKFAGQDETVFYSETSDTFDLPCTVLCNGGTASAGELFCAALKDFRDMGLINARIIGETTYKKGVMQNTFTFSDSSALTMTVAYYNPPSNVNYDSVGVVPDIECPLPEDAESDVQLEMAVRELEAMILAE